MFRPIHIGLSPNTAREDYLVALKTVCQPWMWKKGITITKVESWFKDYFHTETAVSFNAGRSALLAILNSLELEKGSEVFMQAFTCVAVPNAVIWTGAHPVFVDIDSSLNFDVTDALKKVTSKTKAVIVQHTFGVPADMDKIIHFCNKHNLVLIEDCAHSLGATHKGKLVGTLGDASFFSFGRDKVVSSVFGGMAIINSKFKIQSSKLKEYQKNLKYPSYFWIFQQLMHPLISFVVLHTYNFFQSGKIILFVAQKLRLLSLPVYPQEKRTKQPPDFPKKYPNVLAMLLLVQLNKLAEFNLHRKEIAASYFKEIKGAHLHKESEAIYLRFNLLMKNADQVRFSAKQKGMILGNWYANLIDPQGSDGDKLGYVWGSCPKAEKAARECINLPTYPTLTTTQSKQIIQFINNIYATTSN